MDSNTDILRRQTLAASFRASSKILYTNDSKDGVAIKKNDEKVENTKSPVQLFVSGKRAVAVLKELSVTKVRSGQALAKHMNITEQAEQLGSTPLWLGCCRGPESVRALCEGGGPKFRTYTASGFGLPSLEQGFHSFAHHQIPPRIA
jgi:hypothetical protein